MKVKRFTFDFLVLPIYVFDAIFVRLSSYLKHLNDSQHEVLTCILLILII